MSLLSGVANAFFSQLAQGDSLMDYQHAARTFVDGLYRLSPKHQTLYHVFIDLNPAVANLDAATNIEIGMMAKTVNLPKFSVTTKTLNSYNRKSVIQEKINYDPLTITFHDDNADIIRNFWYRYYSYYYRDSDHSLTMYNQDYKYKQRQEQNWGFTPLNSLGTQNYINLIRIYSLHQKSFSSYILVRPTITSFTHGEHAAGDYGPIEHTMQIAYEAIQYETGLVSQGSVIGFKTLHYDNTPSPLSTLGGGTTSILGPGGLLAGINSVTSNLQNGNFVGAALGALRTANNFKNTNLSTVATAELSQLGMNVLRSQNAQSTIFAPTAASVNRGLGTAIPSLPGSGGLPSIGIINNLNRQNNQVGPTNQSPVSLISNLF